MNNTQSQDNNNQPFIIKRVKEYQKWTDTSGGRILVPLTDFISPLLFEVPYETKNNFTGKRLYRNHSFWIAREAGEKLSKVQDSLNRMGLGLFFFDTYRPYAVTEKMWEIVPDEKYAANPKYGSGHNRGAAVDLTVVDAPSGRPLPMPTDFDNFSDSAHHDFMDLPVEWVKNKLLLKGIMEFYGFKSLSTEWWHYSLPNAKVYPLLDLNFKQLKRHYRKNKKKTG